MYKTRAYRVVALWVTDVVHIDLTGKSTNLALRLLLLHCHVKKKKKYKAAFWYLFAS